MKKYSRPAIWRACCVPKAKVKEVRRIIPSIERKCGKHNGCGAKKEKG
jgi:hypothetical protein